MRDTGDIETQRTDRNTSSSSEHSNEEHMIKYSNMSRDLWEELINPRRHECRLMPTASDVHYVVFNAPPFLHAARTDTELKHTPESLYTHAASTDTTLLHYHI